MIDDPSVPNVECCANANHVKTAKCSCSVAGTVGAIVTCPLEVVKTRLQSSCSGFQEHLIPQIAQESVNGAKTTCRTVPDQRRRLWTSSRSYRPQVVALSGYVAHNTSPTMSLVQMLRHIITQEGPLALFKGIPWISYATNHPVLHEMHSINYALCIYYVEFLDFYSNFLFMKFIYLNIYFYGTSFYKFESVFWYYCILVLLQSVN